MYYKHQNSQSVRVVHVTWHRVPDSRGKKLERTQMVKHLTGW